MDAKRRHPGNVDYDPKTLHLPPEFVKSLTGGQRQWWEFKSKHMDKMGKFYELFEMDAHGEQPHCGFPGKNFSMNVEKLARKVVKREVCAVITKGTLTEGEFLSANPDASYLMTLTESSQGLTNQIFERIFGVCVVDVTTDRIIPGRFGDEAECSSLCCLLSEPRPVEILKPAKMLSSETERVLVRHTRNPLVNKLAPLSEFGDAEKTFREVKTISKHIGENGSLALSALGGTLNYLKQVFLDETFPRFAKFESLLCSDFCEVAKKPYMILDAAALENLEIFENRRNGDSSGTLYAQLNHCVTPLGKRLLKTWLARPLYHLESIIDRLDAVAGLQTPVKKSEPLMLELNGVNQAKMLEFRKVLSRLPDLKWLLARIFSASEANGRNANKVVLHEDAAKKQLQEFISALHGCKFTALSCSSLAVILENVESGQLHHLLTPGKGRPDILPILKHFKSAFDWVEANNSGRIVPHEGVDME
ncbi:unnamed protein product [Dovyalis caffra]|uniref:Uncharacterized protein n=1 Tax=Dovyalis caffra TaxID=77055 RepID=A0AAV1SAP8_9ROSI|nr:unnamed protein product [Dovyalis caffra]